MEVKFLGGCREVGRSAIEVRDVKQKIILDYGMKIATGQPEYPEKTKNVSAVIISHSHLDHSGATPELYKREKPPLFTNSVTLETMRLLLKDSLKIAKIERYRTPYNKNDMKNMIRHAKFVDYEKPFKIGPLKCTLHDAGHVPGSMSALIAGKKSVFYTGDITLKETELLHGARLPAKADVLITESTYSEKDHITRTKEIERFKDSVEAVIANEETAVIPSFAVGRAQEILLMLEDYADKIALDGMTKEASEIILSHPEFIKDRKRLKRVLNNVTWIHTHEEREKVIGQFPLIVSTAGMLSGGPAVYYITELQNNPSAHIFFTGFLEEDSPGRQLIKTSVFEKGEEKFAVKCHIDQFDFSGHAGRTDLFKIIEHVRPELVVCLHGDNCEKFAKEINKRFTVNAVAPKTGDVLKV